MCKKKSNPAVFSVILQRIPYHTEILCNELNFVALVRVSSRVFLLMFVE